MASPVKTLATAAILALAAAPASAALPAPPFDFSLSPAAVTEGAPATVRIAPVRPERGRARDLRSVSRPGPDG